MSWFTIRQFPIDEDLSGLARELRARRIPHRFSERGSSLCLEVPEEPLSQPVAEFVEAWFAGQVSAAETSVEPTRSGPSLWEQARLCPITLLLIVLSLVGFAVVRWPPLTPWVGIFTFVPIHMQGSGLVFGELSEVLRDGELWRLVSPAFLHFSVLHIAFNSLWCWELGRRIEWLVGPGLTLAFFVLSATASNLAQYFWPDSSGLFGGMSGVVYAMVGFIGVHQYFRPHPLMAVPRGIIMFMLVWLVICMVGIVDFFMSGGVANGAHLGGLVSGSLLALLFLSTTPVQREKTNE